MKQLLGSLLIPVLQQALARIALLLNGVALGITVDKCIAENE